MSEKLLINSIEINPHKPKTRRLSKDERNLVREKWGDFLDHYGQETDEFYLRQQAEKYVSNFSPEISSNVRASFRTRIINRHKEQLAREVYKDESVWHPVLDVAREKNISESRAVGMVRKLDNTVRAANKTYGDDNEEMRRLGIDRRERDEASNKALGLLAQAFIGSFKEGTELEESVIKVAQDKAWSEINFFGEPQVKQVEPVKQEPKKSKVVERVLSYAVVVAGLALTAYGLFSVFTDRAEAKIVEENNPKILGYADAQVSPNQQVVEATPQVILPTIETSPISSPEPSATPDPLETRDRTGYKLGELDLRKPFKVDFPEIGKQITIEPGVNMDRLGTTKEVSEKNADWRNYPNFSTVYNGDNQTVVENFAATCHGFQKEPNGCDWLERYELEGKRMILTQELDGKTIITEMEVSKQQIISLAKFTEGSKNGYNKKDPAFVDLPIIGFVNDRPGLTLIECVGDLVFPYANPDEYDYSGRELVQGSVVSQVVIDENGGITWVMDIESDRAMQ